MALTWTIRTSSFGSDQINDVCWSAFQAQWVAVGNSNKLATSPDGITWTQRTSPFPFGFVLISVNYSPTLNQWLIVDSSWGVATSPDGINWTQQAGFAGNAARNCKWSEHDQLWAVAHQSSLIFGSSPNGAGVSTSPDGVTWTKRNAITGARQPFGIDYSIASDEWVIVGDSDTLVKGLTQSSNAITWTQVTTYPIAQPNLRTVRYSEILDMWMVAGQSTVYKSVDGLFKWSSNIASDLIAVVPGGTSLLFPFTIDFNNYLWFVLGRYLLPSGYNAACLFTSIDGIHWEFSNTGLVQPPSPTGDQALTGSGYNPTLGMYIVVGSQGHLATAIEPAGTVVVTGDVSMNWRQGKV